MDPMAYNLQNPLSFRPVHNLSREEIKQERAQIDCKILELESALRTLKQRRNALAPVYRLSADVMICIFEHLQNPYQQDQPDDLPHDPPRYPFAFQTPLHVAPATPEVHMPWVRAMTHVCAQWRTLALDTPTLWTRHRLRSYDLAQEMSRRSQSALISVIFDVEDLRCNDRRSLFSDIIRTASNRIKHLEIASSNSSVHTNFVSAALRCLSKNTTMEAFYCKTARRFGLPSPQGLYMPMGFLRYSASTLQYLTLENCNFSTEGIDLPIPLPLLARLTIIDDINQCAELLQRVRIPSTCSVYIVAYAQNQTAYQVLNDPVHSFWEHRRNPIKSMSIIIPPKAKQRAIRLCLGVDETKDENFVLVLAVLAPFGHTMTEAIRGLCSGLPILNVSHIRVGVDLDKIIWTSLSGWCPAVKSLEVLIGTLRGFFHVLIGGEDNSGNTVIVEQFLSLETLTVGDYFDYDILQGKGLLRGWIQRRISLGVPLKRLNLYASHKVPEPFIQNLGHLVEVQFALV